MKDKILNWRIEQSAEKSKLYIYDDVTEYGEFNWNTWKYDESETSAKFFRDKLEEIPEGKEIELHINSDGGSVKEGTAIYNLLKQKPNKKTGIVDGVAHSIAFLILQACDVRKMCLGTSALIHNMWMYCYGNATQLRKYADDLDVLSESNRKVFMERAKISEDELKELMDAETYLTPEAALEYGLIDEIEQRADSANEGETIEDLREQLSQMRRSLTEQQSLKQELKEMLASVKTPEGQNKKTNLFETLKNSMEVKND